jgi:BASS family bile acid:Na+ symporter
MLGIGINLEIKDFKRVFYSPKAVLFGLFGQLIVLPLIGFGIALTFPLDPVFQLGIVLIAVCPGGTSSNLVTYMLRGRVALSVSMTAFNSFLIVLTIPFILNIAFATFWESNKVVELSVFEMFSEVVFTVLLPVITGAVLRHYFPMLFEKVKKPLRYILPSILFIVFSLVLFIEQGDGGFSMDKYMGLIGPVIALNFLVIIIGFFSSGWIGINHRGKYTIAIEMGLQNSALAIFLANNVIQIDDLALIAVIYGGFSFFTTYLLAYLMKRFL